MRHRLPPWAVLVALAVVCAAAIAVVQSIRLRSGSTAALLERLPTDGAIVVRIDFAALRDSGVLSAIAGSNVAQEPEYRSFVDQTGFDYLHDLDSALVSIHSTGTYMVLRGRFDWKALASYATIQGGECYNTTCHVQGSTPERKISFFPIEPSAMGLAVSKDATAADSMKTRRPGAALPAPADPIWAWIPVSSLSRAQNLPAGTRLFIRTLTGADRILLTAGPDGAGLAIRLDVACRSAAEAAALTTQLTSATRTLRELIAQQKQKPNPSDLSGILAAGAFEQTGDHVRGKWPVEREFLEALAGSPLT